MYNMKKIITEKTLRNVIKKTISEALEYNKAHRQYFPDYTGNPHSDAGKFASNGGDDYNYSRNDYKWSNPESQKRFQNLQWRNDLEPNIDDPNREDQYSAEEYMSNKDPYTLVQKASEAMSGEFQTLLGQLCNKAAQQFPILKNPYYMSDFVYKLRDELDNFEY